MLWMEGSGVDLVLIPYFFKTYLLPFSKTSPLKNSSDYNPYSFFLLSSSFNFVVTILFHWRISTIFLFTTTTSATILGNFIIHAADLLNTLAAQLDEFVPLLAETNLSTQHWILPPSTHANDSYNYVLFSVFKMCPLPTRLFLSAVVFFILIT